MLFKLQDLAFEVQHMVPLLKLLAEKPESAPALRGEIARAHGKLAELSALLLPPSRPINAALAGLPERPLLVESLPAEAGR